MGKRNRVKRAAKKRDRQRRGPTPPRWARDADPGGPHGPGCTCEAGSWTPPPGPEEVAELLFDAVHAVRARADTATARAAELAGRFEGRVGVLYAGAGIALGAAVGEAWERGWLPVDVWEDVRRTTDAAATDLLVDAIAADSAQHAPAAMHPRWTAQLERLDARVWWRHDEPHLARWAQRRGIDVEQALTVTIGLLSKLAHLRRLPQILPPPGAARPASANAGRVDQKVLARVRGLLAKAESTEFPEEAEALSAKAQELMNRHAFERALLDADTHQQHSVTSIRLWLDGPYLDPKSSLVSAIARANRCRAVFYPDQGFVALVGAELDLEISELLATSLLVQATRAMVAAGTDRYGGTSRTRSFRRAFLLAYAGRIGERLAEATERAHDPADDPRLLPVLASRSRAVDEAFEAMFPDTYRPKSTSISNHAGWHAGRAAADRARLDIERRAVSA